ncbi:hypothetical protein DR66_5987 [Delftia acidovorans]|uniref:hypothetical protein n=1 Tax=Delftia acidovorans TaxID=80866 RepID=UPI0005069241|nr:hypothetical protein [Delftia acidovorans]KFJ08494.1 hypothetical protein DR66_5987 [Delftia acidovorans]QQB48362.1 hypothetical protein I6H54_18440 [Delftia acidovorans]
MTLNATLQLSDSIGLGRFIYFSGLEYPVLLTPTVHGEPLLTAQSIYYIDRLESVANIRGKSNDDMLPEDKIEYLMDNYLFEFSKLHPESRVTFKVADYVFWRDDPDSKYSLADHRCTSTLTLDQSNDSAVLSIEAIDEADDVDLGDWDIGRNYSFSCISEFIAGTASLLEKKVLVKMLPDEHRDGYFGKLRVVKAEGSYIDFFQARALEYISVRNITSDTKHISLNKSQMPGAESSLPVEHIVTTRMHNPVLLSHFFSGIKELNPLKGYLSYYNVLEYYFEEAPLMLDRSARTELEQLKCTLEILVSDADVKEMLTTLTVQSKTKVFEDLPTSSGVPLKRLDDQAASIRSELARWLYDIRCAVVHSKKTRRGVAVASFEPYSTTTKNLDVAVFLVRNLAIKCIEKDTDLQNMIPT